MPLQRILSWFGKTGKGPASLPRARGNVETDAPPRHEARTVAADSTDEADAAASDAASAGAITAEEARRGLLGARRLVIKVGSALIAEGTAPRRLWLRGLAADINRWRRNGTQIVIVSSGAVALGQSALGFAGRPERLEDAQAAASIGQLALMEAFQHSLKRYDVTAAQLLLTIGDLEDRPRYLNARQTIEALLARDILPIVNENDTVATSELRFGDNDRLAARVAQMAGADGLLLLSDVDGLYTADPRHDPGADFLDIVPVITDEIEAMAGPPAVSGLGSGGMVTKVAAARIAVAAGCTLAIMNGRSGRPLNRLDRGERATFFPASGDPLNVRKQWIRGLMAPVGFLHMDAGALDALKRGASLLPAGVTDVEGGFARGDLVAFIGADGRLVGQGLSAYSSGEAGRIRGHQLSDIPDILGYVGRSALVHRDDLVLF